MDAVGHALITTAVSDDLFAIAASAMRLDYGSESLTLLGSVFPSQSGALALAIESRKLANFYVHRHHLFGELQRVARPILISNGFRDNYSHPAMEAAIDHLLLEGPDESGLLEKAWDSFNWDKLVEYRKRFSRKPEHAERSIKYVRNRLMHREIGYVAEWLWQVTELTGKVPQQLSACNSVMLSLASALRGGEYKQIIYGAQQELRNRINPLHF